VTAPARLSPTASFFNALLRLYIRRARPIIATQQKALDEATNLNHRLRTARDFADSDRSGYVHRTGLEITDA
jgi:hypothetical protein